MEVSEGEPMKRLLFAALALAVLAVSAQAGKYNKKVSIGDPCPEWTDLPGIDGKKHSLADLKDRDLVVVAIICNQCVVSQDYEQRIIDFTKKYAQAPGSKVAVVGINVCKGDDEKLSDMVERAKKQGFNFPYLLDETQMLGRKLGAVATPTFFVLDKSRKIVYMGALDDDVRPEQVTEKYLAPAVDALLKGEKPANAETRPVGCAIQYQKK
jgi:peroxiredoxin